MKVTIYTDGACLGNPGPGGYGVVMLYAGHRKELSGGFLRTTNNRMEIIAAIRGLESLTEKCRVVLYSDSAYVVDAVNKGWAEKWQADGWNRDKKKGIKAKNPDLWAKLLELVRYHEADFRWVRGHSGNVENERCDHLATESAKCPSLPVDSGFRDNSSCSVRML